MPQIRPLDPAMERADGYQFQVGELIKSWNIHGYWCYGYVVEDCRQIPYCNYLYTVAPVIPEPSDGGFTVYGCEPKNMEPTSAAEQVLFGADNPNYWKGQVASSVLS